MWKKTESVHPFIPLGMPVPPRGQSCTRIQISYYKTAVQVSLNRDHTILPVYSNIDALRGC